MAEQSRLGHPRMQLAQEPRLDPRLLAVVSQYNLDRTGVLSSLSALSPGSTLDEVGASMADAGEIFENIYERLPDRLLRDRFELAVEVRPETITNSNGSHTKLQIYRPTVKGGALPCVVYCHGGGAGVSFMTANNNIHRRWCISLAAQGMIVVSVEYRNAYDKVSGFHPFPAALNDVCAAVHFVYTRRELLNTRNIVLHGDGSGAGLVLAAAIKAVREGWISRIDGIYAYSPFISNAYSWTEGRKLADLPSLIECHGYVTNVDCLAYMAHLYTPRSSDAMNPLAWPYHATQEDLAGLPPHIMAMDELSPLRSEGEAYTRKLVRAGVKAVGHVILGSVQGACLSFRQTVPEMHQDLVRHIAAFAKQV
ncbi:hypothetical protein LTR53_005976 [Teratosphaeriaceae sp. CCFEE 6253]|nr:hypothetical protein LTR53_005976 [Teratosphaeriaceae sp. CCFEE 6253]